MPSSADLYLLAEAVMAVSGGGYPTPFLQNQHELGSA